MNPPKAQYCYAIVNKKNNAFFLSDHKLPFYWSKKIAHEDLNKIAGSSFTVVRVSFESLRKYVTNS